MLDVRALDSGNVLAIALCPWCDHPHAVHVTLGITSELTCRRRPFVGRRAQLVMDHTTAPAGSARLAVVA